MLLKSLMAGMVAIGAMTISAAQSAKADAVVQQTPAFLSPGTSIVRQTTTRYVGPVNQFAVPAETATQFLAPVESTTQFVAPFGATTQLLAPVETSTQFLAPMGTRTTTTSSVITNSALVAPIIIGPVSNFQYRLNMLRDQIAQGAQTGLLSGATAADLMSRYQSISSAFLAQPAMTRDQYDSVEQKINLLNQDVSNSMSH